MASTFNLSEPRQRPFSDATTLEPAPWNRFTRISSLANGPPNLHSPLSSHPISAREQDEGTMQQPTRTSTPLPASRPLPPPSPERRAQWKSIPNAITDNSLIEPASRNPNPYSARYSSPPSDAPSFESLSEWPTLLEQANTPKQSTNLVWEPTPKRPVETIHDPTLSHTPSPKPPSSWTPSLELQRQELGAEQVPVGQTEVRTSKWVEDQPTESRQPQLTRTSSKESSNPPRTILPSTHQASPIPPPQPRNPSPLPSTPALSPPPIPHLNRSTSPPSTSEDFQPMPLERAGAVRAKYERVRGKGRGGGGGDAEGGNACGECGERRRKWGRWWMWALVAFVVGWIMFALGAVCGKGGWGK